MTRTYTVTLPRCGDKVVTREMPARYDEARYMAAAMAMRNSAWLDSEWTARDGDSFSVDAHAEIVDASPIAEGGAA